jgi:hypothetical protein
MSLPRRAVAAVSIVGLALVGAWPATAAAQPPRTATVAVSGPALFTDSKIMVRAGEQITVSATGTWRHRRGTFGPGGDPGASTGPCRIAQLTGRVGLFGKTRCFATSAVTFTAEANGYLLFWMNDGPGLGGTLSVTVNGGDPASTLPPSLPRPPVSDPAQFDRVCNPPFMFRNEDPSGGRVFTDVVQDVPAWFRAIARDVCSRLYKTPAEARTVVSVEFFLRNCGGVAGKWGDREIGIEVCTPHLRNVNNAGQSVKDEVSGIMEHEVTHGYQHDDKPDSNPDIGIIEGVADAVRLSAGLISPGELRAGGSWNSGYKTTAFFLVWLDTQYADFFYRFNLSFRPDGKAWSSAEFQRITGKPVANLWADFQRAIQNGSSPRTAG